MNYTTTNTYIAAWLESAGFRHYHADVTGTARRYYFYDSEKLQDAVYTWKEWTGGNYRQSLKRLNGNR